MHRIAREVKRRASLHLMHAGDQSFVEDELGPFFGPATTFISYFWQACMHACLRTSNKTNKKKAPVGFGTPMCLSAHARPHTRA